MASLVGYVHIFDAKDLVSRKRIKIYKNNLKSLKKNGKKKMVEVRRNFEEKSHLVPSPGKIVTARVYCFIKQLNNSFKFYRLN